MIKHLDPNLINTVLVPTSRWWRVYNRAHGSLSFNGTLNGNARFSPITDKHGDVIPILYAGSSVQIALMETVLHDAPIPSDGFNLVLPNVVHENREIAGLVNAEPLKLVDFSSVALRRLGFIRSEVIDCDKTHYPYTRELAQWVYEHKPLSQGIQWTSRQDDRGMAIVLFGNRINASTLQIFQQGTSIYEEANLRELIDLLDVLGAGLVCS